MRARRRIDMSDLRPNSKGGQDVMCDCCGREILAEIRDGKVIIFTERHGRRHFTVIELAQVGKVAALDSKV